MNSYRSGPSLLHRYFPFWMINYARRTAAIMVAAVAVVIPLFTYTPGLYAWLLNLRLAKLYRRLRFVNERLKEELSVDQIASLQADLDHIDRTANILPMRHSDQFFALLMHIRLTRTELAARLTSLRGSSILAQISAFSPLGRKLALSARFPLPIPSARRSLRQPGSRLAAALRR